MKTGACFRYTGLEDTIDEDMHHGTLATDSILDMMTTMLFDISS